MQTVFSFIVMFGFFFVVYYLFGYERGTNKKELSKTAVNMTWAVLALGLASYLLSQLSKG